MSMVSVYQYIVTLNDNIVDKVFPTAAGGASTQSFTATTLTQVEGTMFLQYNMVIKTIKQKV